GEPDETDSHAAAASPVSRDAPAGGTHRIPGRAGPGDAHGRDRLAAAHAGAPLWDADGGQHGVAGVAQAGAGLPGARAVTHQARAAGHGSPRGAAGATGGRAGPTPATATGD